MTDMEGKAKKGARNKWVGKVKVVTDESYYKTSGTGRGNENGEVCPG